MDDFPYSVSVDLNLSFDVEGATEDTPKDEIIEAVENFIAKIFEGAHVYSEILEIYNEDKGVLYRIGQDG